MKSTAFVPSRITWPWLSVDDFIVLRSIRGFAATIAVTSGSWILVTQLDKILLAGVLPLSDLGYFSLAVTLASGIMIVAGPIGLAIMPRMARLEAEGNPDAVFEVYRRATRSLSLLVLPAGAILTLFSPQVLFIWTGSASVAERAGNVLSLYAAGYTVLAFTAMAYHVQYAKGDLKWHLFGSILVLVPLIPGMIWSARRYGLDGPGLVWFAIHAVYLAIWVPLIHRRVLPGIHVRWLVCDIGVPFFVVTALALSIDCAFKVPQDRASAFVWFVFVYVVLFAGAFLSARLVNGRNNEYLWN
jgi:O-antigen/teichoic acid export membrane protein